MCWWPGASPLWSSIQRSFIPLSLEELTFAQTFGLKPSASVFAGPHFVSSVCADVSHVVVTGFRINADGVKLRKCHHRSDAGNTCCRPRHAPVYQSWFNYVCENVIGNVEKFTIDPCTWGQKVKKCNFYSNGLQFGSVCYNMCIDVRLSVRPSVSKSNTLWQMNVYNYYTDVDVHWRWTFEHALIYHQIDAQQQQQQRAPILHTSVSQ